MPVNIDWDVSNFREIYDNSFGKIFGTEREKSDKRITKIQSGWMATAILEEWNLGVLEEALDIKIETARLIVTEPGAILNIHKDCVSDGTVLRPWTINVPIAGCANGPNEWFNIEDNPDLGEQFVPGGGAYIPTKGSQYYRENPHELTVSESMILDGIRMLRTDIYHWCNNSKNTERRIILSTRSSHDISWDDIVTRVNKLNSDK